MPLRMTHEFAYVIAKGANLYAERGRIITVNKIDCTYFGARHYGKHEEFSRHDSCKKCNPSFRNVCRWLSKEFEGLCHMIKNVDEFKKYDLNLTECHTMIKKHLPYTCTYICNTRMTSEKNSEFGYKPIEDLEATCRWRDDYISFGDGLYDAEMIERPLDEPVMKKKKRSMFNFGGKK